MFIQTHRFTPLLLLILAILFLISNPINGLDSTRKLDEVKCGSCTESPPPPPPSPPPPSTYPADCPPPPKKTPSSKNYPPPPPPPGSFIYMTGPPGQLYPIVQDYGSGSGKMCMAKVLMAVCGFLVVFW